MHSLKKGDVKYVTHLQKLLYAELFRSKIKYLKENDTQETKRLNCIAS